MAIFCLGEGAIYEKKSNGWYFGGSYDDDDAGRNLSVGRGGKRGFDGNRSDLGLGRHDTEEVCGEIQ